MGKVATENTLLELVRLTNEGNVYLKNIAQEKEFDPGNWTTMRNLSEAGLLKDYTSVGNLIVDPWTDTAANQTYDAVWHVADFQDVELHDGKTSHATQLQWHYATPFGVQFSHQRAFLACPDGLAANTYYFTIESAWGNNVSAGDVVCFTLANDVPAGGKIAGCYGAPDQLKSNWRVYVYDAAGRTVLETVTPTFTASGINLGTQHSNKREGMLNSTQEMAYGWNRWSTSALRQWLNSDKPKNEWWTAQDEWDIAPDQLTQKDGFLCGCDPELVKAMRTVKVVTYPNTVNDDPGGNTADITYDKVYLLSLEQMYINPQKSGEGEPLEYWKQVNGTDTKWAQYGTYEILKHYGIENKTNAQSVRLRSALRGYANSTWIVYSSGYVYGSYASVAYRFSPACNI